MALFFKSKSEKLMDAVLKNDLAAVQKAIAKGADVNFKETEKSQRTPLIYAAWLGNVEIVKELIKHGADVNLGNKCNIAPIDYAAKYNRLEALQEIIAAGANVNSQAINGATPLISAIGNRHIKIIKELLKHKANVNLGGEGKTSPLGYAAYFNRIDIVKELISAGAEVNYKDRNDAGPLVVALHKGNPDVARYLIEHGAEINAQMRDGLTPLMVAASSDKYINNLKLLLEHKADLSIKNHEGLTARDIAVRYNTTLALSFIDEHLEDTSKESETWKKMGNDRIAFTGLYPEQGEKLTEIFNFSSRQQLISSENLVTKEKTSFPPVSFNDLHKKIIEKAVLEFEAQGGSVDKCFVFHGNTINKNIKPLK